MCGCVCSLRRSGCALLLFPRVSVRLCVCVPTVCESHVFCALEVVESIPLASNFIVSKRSTTKPLDLALRHGSCATWKWWTGSLSLSLSPSPYNFYPITTALHNLSGNSSPNLGSCQRFLSACSYFLFSDRFNAR